MTYIERIRWRAGRAWMAIAFAAALAAPAAQAVPVTWTVDPLNTSITFSASALGILSGSGSTSATGTITGDFDPIGGSLSASGGTIALDDFAVTGQIAANATNLTAQLLGGPAAIAAGIADLGGFTLTVLTGMLDVTAPIATMVDFAGAPPAFAVPAGTSSTLTNLGGLTYEWVIPLNLAATLDASGIPVDLTTVGTVTLLTTVPEPGTALLLASGLGGLVAFGRRKR